MVDKQFKKVQFFILLWKQDTTVQITIVVDTFHCHTQEPMIIYHLAGGFQVERILPTQWLPMRGWDH